MAPCLLLAMDEIHKMRVSWKQIIDYIKCYMLFKYKIISFNWSPSPEQSANFKFTDSNNYTLGPLIIIWLVKLPNLLPSSLCWINLSGIKILNLWFLLYIILPPTTFVIYETYKNKRAAEVDHQQFLLWHHCKVTFRWLDFLMFYKRN